MFLSAICRTCRLMSALGYQSANSSKLIFYKNYKTPVTTRLPILRSYSSENSSHNDPSLKTLRRVKRVFALTMFSLTFGCTYYFNKKKGSRRKEILEDCQKLRLDASLFDAKVSLYKYKGYIFPGEIIMSGTMKELENFNFRKDDIVVASFPKTGTTWVQEIVYMLTHSCKVSTSNDKLLETRFPYLEYPYPGIKTVANLPDQRCIKTHLPYSLLPPSFEDSGAKLIYITRNPRDTAVSYFYFTRLLTVSAFAGTLQDFLDLFTTDRVAYAPFFGHVREYWNKRSSDNVLFITYEQLHKDPRKIIKQIAQFIECPVSEEDVNYIAYHTSFQSMSNNPSVNYEHWKDIGFAFKDRGKFMRKGCVGNWKEEMSSTMINQFDNWEKHNLNTMDISFTPFSRDSES